jgi:AcrR family transcriptional regulator
MINNKMIIDHKREMLYKHNGLPKRGTMARRSDHSREELHALALTAARRIVEAEGLRGLGARRVAREIGYTIGTIYNIFEDFDDLIDQMNGQTLDQLHQVCGRSEGEDEPATRLRRLADRYVGFSAAHPKLYVALFEHQHPGDGRPPEWFGEKVSGLLRLVEAAIAPIMPDAAPGKVEAQARVLWAGVHGIISLETADKLGGSGQAGELVDLLLENFLSATE